MRVLCWLVFILSGCAVTEVAPARQADLSSSDQAALMAIDVREGPGRGIPVLQDHHLDRPTEVIAILDVHSESGHEDRAVAEIKARAAAVGADAVVGAEFHHGEGNEPTHLSGVAVRFVNLEAFP